MIPQVGAKMAPVPSNLEPRWPQDLASWSQDGQTTPQLGAKMTRGPLFLEPRWHQDPQLGAQIDHDSTTWRGDAPKTPLSSKCMKIMLDQVGAQEGKWPSKRTDLRRRLSHR